MLEGNLPIRQPIGGGESGRIFVKVTETPATGRKRYKGKRVRYTLVGLPPNQVLTTSVLTKELTFYNLLEAAAGNAFLVIGDEVEIFKYGSVTICLEIPRGFA